MVSNLKNDPTIHYLIMDRSFKATECDILIEILQSLYGIKEGQTILHPVGVVNIPAENVPLPLRVKKELRRRGYQVNDTTIVNPSFDKEVF